MPKLAQSPLLRWLIAIVAYPLGGFLGHAVAGPASTILAALVSGVLAGAVIGLAQALALKLEWRSLLRWTVTTAVGLGLALGGVTGVLGQIADMSDAVVLGIISGLLLGAGQALVLHRMGIARSWAWVAASTIAWGSGWLITTGIGVDLAAGWPVYGLSGAIASQLITGLVVWRLIASRPAAIVTPA